MSRIASFARLSAFACLLGGLLASGAAQAQALELHFTGILTSVHVLPGTAVGDPVSGSMSFEAGAFATTSSDGASFALATHDTTPPLSHTIITLQNGTVFETGTHAGVQETSVSLERNYPDPQPGTNLYALSSYDPFGPDNATATLVQLAMADFLGTASTMFATPAGDLTLLQPVDWFAAGVTNIGQFNAGNSSGQFTLTSLEVVSTSPAPEPETLALLGAGLAAVAGRIAALQRRKRPAPRATSAS